MRRLILLAASALALGACSKEAKLEETAVCPALKSLTEHSVVIKTARPIPETLGIVLDGVFKYNECAKSPVLGPAPFVQARRSKEGIGFRVIHAGGYPTLPTEMSFEIWDLGDCKTESKTF